MRFDRPLSPHLTWYRPQITSVMSIMHRLSGIALVIGAFVLLIWLIAIALGGGTYEVVRAALASPIGMTLLAGWSAAFFYHLCNGIRHLAWDAGYGFEIATVYRSGYAVLIATALLTLGSWLVAAIL